MIYADFAFHMERLRIALRRPAEAGRIFRSVCAFCFIFCMGDDGRRALAARMGGPRFGVPPPG